MGYALGSVYVKKMFDDQAESEVGFLVLFTLSRNRIQ